MEGPRGARPEELPLVEKLANTVFRGERDDAPKTMFQEYPDLYHVSNADNIRIILEDGKPVANINFLPQTISIYGCNISAATLGGVCTLKEYRGRGYGTMLLKDCIDRMRSMGISVLHISGDRSMYRNAGSLPAGRVRMYELASSNAYKLYYDGLEIEEYKEDQLEIVVKLYRQESVRYIRSLDRFRILLNSNKFIDRIGTVRKTILIKEGNRYVAYIILVIRSNGEAYIPDWAGSRKAILGSASLLIEKYGLKLLQGYMLDFDDEALAICSLNNIVTKESRLPGTIKIINFVKFMEELRPYFYELYEESFVKRLEFLADEEGMGFKHGDDCIMINDLYRLNDLIFGGGEAKDDDFRITGNAGKIKDFFRRVFPIPFVYTGNLSYV